MYMHSLTWTVIMETAFKPKDKYRVGLKFFSKFYVVTSIINAMSFPKQKTRHDLDFLMG